jgi:PKD repeat protein
MKFVDQTSPTPTPFPPIAKINCRAEVVEDNYCSGTADGDSNTPTITLFSASTDPDGDIESCYWKIYNSENEIEKESDTCQPITFGDEVGTYRATLEVVDMAGNKDEDDYTFEVKRQQTELIADFSWEPAIPIVTKQVDFFDRSIVLEGDSITKWSWSFEDATPATSKEQNPTGVIFNTSGPKSVTLTITTSSGMKETVTKTINVRSINPEWEEVIPK